MKLLRRLSLLSVAIALLVKVFLLNDTSVSFSDDPLELWVALGVAMLLIDRSSS